MASTKQQIRDLMALNLPDNTTGLITPAKHREVLTEVINTMASLAAGEPQQTSESEFQHDALHNFTGGLQAEGIDIVVPANTVVVNNASDFPAAVAGVITLVADTQYTIGASVNIGTDRIAFSPDSSIRGSGRLSASIVYTGTGDLFTISNARTRIENISISCTAGRFVNFSDNTDSLLIIDECTISCATIGLFNSVGTNGSVVRSSNTTITATAGGITFTGNFNRFIWLVSGMTISAGSIFDLGTATFNSFLTNIVGPNLAAGTYYISGATGSANINTGGSGQVVLTRFTGAGTPLSGVTVDDALWEFHHNDDIADTRPDGLLHMQDNTIETVIAATSTPVLIAGTWVVDRSSQFTGTTGGRLTSDGGKPFTTPITAGVSIEPSSGTNKILGAFVAINGTAVTGSRATANVDAGDPKRITVIWQVVLQPGDYVDIFVSNETDTTNIVVSDAVHRVN